MCAPQASEVSPDFKERSRSRTTACTSNAVTKVHLDSKTVLTSQLFFDEAVNEAVFKREPYSQKTGRDVFNDGDDIFDEALLVSARSRATGTRPS